MALISKRAEVVKDWKDFLIKYCLLCASDGFDERTNPDGYINFGTAVNNLCNDLFYPKITSSDVWSCDTKLLNYCESYGIPRLRKALASLMTDMLQSSEKISPENLFCVSGATSAIDLMSHCLCDPGDVIMTPTPVYGRIYTNLLQRAEVEMWPVPIITKDNVELEPKLSLEKIKDSYYKARNYGKTVRGILLLNPHNPLGDIYSPELIEEILNFSNEKKLHVIIDEVYAFSVYAKNSRFQSVLALPSIPDPQRTHMIYGMSKDFAAAGLRIGVIFTRCPVLQQCLTQLTMFQVIPFPIMDIAARIFEDLDWCKEFVTVNKQRLLEKFTLFKEHIDKIGGFVRNSEAGFFVWVDFRQKLNISSFEEETAFFNYLIEEFHLYLVPGKELFCEQPGWFRITFTGNPAHIETGLKRLKQAVQQYPLCNKDISVSCTECPQSCDVGIASENLESLENLVGRLTCQIKNSDWLTKNTADKWSEENPELRDLFSNKNPED